MAFNKDLFGNLYVANRSLALGRGAFKHFVNGTELMNIDGVAAGSPVNLWNGTGAADTGSDWTVSGIGSETAGSKHNGTNGWDTGVSLLGQQTVFDNGSMTDIDGTYDTLRFWIQIKAFPLLSVLRVTWVDSTDTVVGNSLRVDDYTTNMDLNEWKQVSIPIEDFALTGNVQKLRFRYQGVGGQQYWLDDIELIASAGGGPHIFRFEAPDANSVYHLSMAVLQVVAPAPGWTSSAFANITGGLLNGLIFRQRKLSTSEVLWKFNSTNNIQLFGQFHPQESFTFAGNDLLLGFMVKPGKANVIITNDDVLEFVVRDDLSSITEMRAYCHYGIESLVEP